jgi:hypothetical protein
MELTSFINALLRSKACHTSDRQQRSIYAEFFAKELAGSSKVKSQVQNPTAIVEVTISKTTSKSIVWYRWFLKLCLQATLHLLNLPCPSC